MCVCVYKSLCTREAAPVLRARTPTPRAPLPRRSPAGLLGQSPPPSTLRVTPQALLPQSWAASPFRLWEWPRGHLCACPLAHKQLSLSQPPQLSSPAPSGLPWGARSPPPRHGDCMMTSDAGQPGARKPPFLPSAARVRIQAPGRRAPRSAGKRVQRPARGRGGGLDAPVVTMPPPPGRPLAFRAHLPEEGGAVLAP